MSDTCNQLPGQIDWPQLIDDIRSKARLYQLKSVARAAGIPAQTVVNLHSRPRNVSYQSAAPLINLHLKLCPDQPIPEKK